MTQACTPGERGFTETYIQSIAEIFSGTQRVGLGFFLSERIIATCDHVAREAKNELRIRVAGGERLARVVYENAARDVAFLQLDANIGGIALLPLELEGSAVAGAKVAFVGWSVAPSNVVERGTMQLHASTIQALAAANLGGVAHASELYELGGDCRPGYSGGPLVLEGQSRACGMVVARDTNEGHAFAIPGPVLEDCYREFAKAEPGTTVPMTSLIVEKPLAPVAGGNYTDKHHIGRPEVDKLVLELFRQHAPIAISAPSMSGKTWWLNHLLPRLMQELGSDGCIVSLTSPNFGSHPDLKCLLLTLIDALVREIAGKAGAKVAREDWEEEINAGEAARHCIEDHFLKRLQGQALLVLELPDGFWDNPRQGDFFGLLRAWSTLSAPWDRLRLVVTYSTAPTVWLSSPVDSPFSTQPVMLQDWTEAEVVQAGKHAGHFITTHTAKKIVDLTGGHPYLVRFIYQDAQTKDQDIDNYLGHLDRDPNPIAKAVGWIFDRCRLRANEKLQDALRGVARGERIPDREAYRRLLDAGLIKGGMANATLRANLFLRILNDHG